MAAGEFLFACRDLRRHGLSDLLSHDLNLYPIHPQRLLQRRHQQRKPARPGQRRQREQQRLFQRRQQLPHHLQRAGGIVLGRCRLHRRPGNHSHPADGIGRHRHDRIVGRAQLERLFGAQPRTAFFAKARPIRPTSRSASGSTTGYTDSTVAANTTYSYEVIATNSAGSSLASSGCFGNYSRCYSVEHLRQFFRPGIQSPERQHRQRARRGSNWA